MNTYEKNEDNPEFAHFSTPQRCGEFVSFLRNNDNIVVKNTCCNGCGCLIPNKTNKEIKLLVSRFNLENPTPTMLFCKEVTNIFTTSIATTECGVCLKDVNSIIMVNVCAVPNHDTCVICYTHLKTNAFSCPFCRGALK